MTMNMKRILLMSLVALLSFSLLACSGRNDGSEAGGLPEEINIGILRVPNDETIAIAEGLFDQYYGERGIEVNYFTFDSGVDANKALASGAVDFATMGNTNAIISLAMDLDVELVWIHEVLGEIEALAVKEGSGIETVEDLAGKKIATPFASTAHYILLNVLKEAGIEDDVQLLDMQTAEIVAAWERGDIDAAYTWQPSLGELLKSGDMLVSSEDMIKKGFITANVAVVRKGFSAQYPDLVVDFTRLLGEAGDVYRNDPELGAEKTAEELGITKEETLVQMRGSMWPTPEMLVGPEYFGTVEEPGDFARIMKDTADFLEAQKSINEAPSQEAFDAYVNPTYIQQSLDSAQ